MSDYPKAKGRRAKTSFLALPRELVFSPNFSALKSSSIRLLVHIGCIYNGSNNGNLSVPFSLLRKYGWKSKETLSNALKDLEFYGFIHKTRQGRFPDICSLYAITWRSLDKSDLYDAGAVTSFVLGSWKLNPNRKKPTEKINQ